MPRVPPRPALVGLLFLLAPPAMAQLELPDEPVRATPKPRLELPVPYRGDLARKVVGSASADGTLTKSTGGQSALDLPRSSQPLVPLRPPPRKAVEPEPEPAPLPSTPLDPGSLASPAAFVLTEVGKISDLDHRILDHGVQSLLTMGESGRLAARSALSTEHGPSILLGARVLLASGHGSDGDLVVARLRQRMPNKLASRMVDDLVRLDPVRASPALLADLLSHPQSAVRAAAHRHLDRDLSPAALPALVTALDGPRSDGRLRAVQLVSKIDDPAVNTALLGRLGDSSAQVALRAIQSLAAYRKPDEAERDEALDAELVRRAFGRRWILRDGAFALLAILEREDLQLRPILSEVHLDPLLDGLGSGDVFLSGTCAAALAGIGFRSDLGEEHTWLDREVPHRLVRAVAGEDFHNDYSALLPAATRRLVLITGQGFASDGPAWLSWWSASASGFSARRAVLPARPEDIPTLRLAYLAATDPPQSFQLLGPVFGTEDQAGAQLEATGRESFFLSLEQARELFELLRADGLFGADVLPGDRVSGRGGLRTLELTLGGRSKRFRFDGTRTQPWFERATAAAVALAERNRWQRFPDPIAHADRAALWRAEAAWWDGPAGELERRRRLKASALKALAVGAPDARGLAELTRLSRHEGVYDAADFPAVVDLLRAEPFLSPRAVELIRLARHCALQPTTTVLAEPGAEPAVSAAREPRLDPDLAGVLLDTLVETFGPEAAVQISSLLGASGLEACRAAAVDPRPFVRAVAATTLAGSEAVEDREALMTLLDDPLPEVEAAAVAALGSRRVESARTELLVRARLGQPIVRQAALVAIGRLGGESVFDALLIGLAEREQPQLQAAAAEGLAELRDPQAAPLLISLLAKGSGDPVFEQARRGLRALGTEAWPELLRVVHSPSHRAKREAALLLAEQGVPQVASVLMSLLSEHADDGRVAWELAVLTCADFRTESEPAVTWWGWWDFVVHDDSLAWLRGALERVGLTAPPPEALTGAGTRPGALFLLDVLGRNEPHLVERARRELSRLFGTDLGSVPPPGRDRDAWRDTLRERIEQRWKE